MFADRATGKIVIAQFPNLPLWIFAGAAVLGWVVSPTGFWGAALDLVGSLALLWWALDAIIRGVNPWRRMLGGRVVLFVVGGAVFEFFG